MKTSTALVKLVVFMVVTSFLTFTLATTIGSIGFGGKTSYKAVFGDVTGLLPGNEIRIAGVRVGKIDDITLSDRQLALVEFSLDGDREIPASTIARLRYRNIVGERYIALTEGAGSAEVLAEGATLPLDQTRNALDLTVLFNGFRPLFQALEPESVNQAAFEIVQTLQGEGGTIESLMARTASLTNTLADRDEVIGRVLVNLESVLETVDERGSELGDLIVQLRRLAAGFAEDRQAIGASLDGISDLTSATAGLLTDIRPPLDQDIANLGALATNLDDNAEVVEGVITRLPDKLDTIIGTATYGSWFNFYLCGIGGTVTLLDGSTTLLDGTPAAGLLNPIESPQLVNPAERCQRGAGAPAAAAAGGNG